jgi:hypothetical protein
MSPKAREFIDFWIQNSVHAAEPLGEAGGEQDVSVLVSRCIEMARSQGISKDDLEKEVGELERYIQEQLRRVNRAETQRRDRR